jgi:phage FluMu protein gp41
MLELDLLEVVSDSEIHPRILDALARLHHDRQEIADLILLNPGVDACTAEYLAARGNALACRQLAVAGEIEEPEPLPAANEPLDNEEPMEDEEPLEEEDEGFLSKYQLAQQMAIAEKIKTALTGDKEWRGLLIKDSNKLVSSAVIKNPRITEPEVLTICKGVVQNDDIIRLICANKEWAKNYQIRKALVTNSKTPLAKAIRYLNTLTEKDIASLAKSKNVSSVISTQARRIMAQKQDKR